MTRTYEEDKNLRMFYGNPEVWKAMEEVKLTRTYEDAIKQAKRDYKVVSLNKKAYSTVFIEGFAWGLAYAISAEFGYEDAEQALNDITGVREPAL